MSFAQLALEWLFCALCIGHVSPNHLKLLSSHSDVQKQKKKGERNPHIFLFFTFQRR